MEEGYTNIDEVLEKFNTYGPYHLKFMFCAWFAYLSNALYVGNYIFAAEEVEYRCKDESFINNTCGVVNSTRCSEWLYENPHSFVAEFNLACEEWKRTLVGSVHSFGYMVGLLIVGPISDRIGRKSTLVMTGVLGGVFGLAKSYTYSYWLYIVLEFLEASIGDCCSPLYILTIEMVTTEKRVTWIFVSNLGFFFGEILCPLLAWAVPYWRDLLHTMYAPAALFILYIFIIDESPRWLLSKGEVDKAITVVRKMSKFNKLKLEEATVNNLSCSMKKSQPIGFGKLLTITFRSRELLKRCFICIIWWTTATFMTYGMMVHSVSLQGNKYINYALVMLMGVTGRFMVVYVLKYFNRRNPLIWSFFASSALCFLEPFIPSGFPWLSVIMYMLSNMLITFFFTIIYIYTSELFPTYTRNSMHAFCSSVGRTGSILATQTPLLMVYWSGLPSILFSGAGLIAGLLTFLVPDVANDSLPDNVEEAEAVGKKKVQAMQSMTLLPQSSNS